MRSLVTQTSGTVTIHVLETSPTWKHTQNPQEQNHLGRHRTCHPPGTEPPKRAKSCPMSPCDHPTNLNWASATHQILPCSPSKGKAHVNQITTPGNDDYKQSSQPCRERTVDSRGGKIQQPPQESPEVVASGGREGKQQVNLCRQHARGPGMMREGAANKGRRVGRGQSPRFQQPGDLSVPDKGVL